MAIGRSSLCGSKVGGRRVWPRSSPRSPVLAIHLLLHQTRQVLIAYGPVFWIGWRHKKPLTTRRSSFGGFRPVVTTLFGWHILTRTDCWLASAWEVARTICLTANGWNM